MVEGEREKKRLLLTYNKHNAVSGDQHLVSIRIRTASTVVLSPFAIAILENPLRRNEFTIVLLFYPNAESQLLTREFFSVKRKSQRQRGGFWMGGRETRTRVRRPNQPEGLFASPRASSSFRSPSRFVVSWENFAHQTKQTKSPIPRFSITTENELTHPPTTGSTNNEERTEMHAPMEFFSHSVRLVCPPKKPF